MRACIELPRDYGWGPVRVLVGRLERDGYHVTEVRGPQYILLALAGSPVTCGMGLSLLPARRPAPKPPRRMAGLQEQLYSTIPVLPTLAPLLPGGGLVEGSVVAVEQPGALCLALMAAASQQGMWCGVAGAPDLGVLAAAEAGVVPNRMMLVPEPGPHWAEVAAAMLNACEVVLLEPPGRAPAQVRRRLETIAWRSGAALIVAGTWEGAPVRLHVTRQQWDGIGYGYGRLRARRGADTATRQLIGDLIFRATARGGQLPAVEDVRRRLGLGLDPAQPGATVAAWLDSWLAGKRRTKRASTVRGYESHIRVHIDPVIGDLPLERLNVGHVEAVLAAVPGSAGTRHRVLATLRTALNTAVKQRQITWNPCTGIELEPENPAGGRWTPAEAARFLVHTADDPMGLMFRVMVLRGCRRAELCGFRWSFADLDHGVLTVKRPILQLGGKLHEEPTAKSRAGDRLVFLDAETADMLRAHHRAQLRGADAGRPRPAGQRPDLLPGRRAPLESRSRVQAVQETGRTGGRARHQAA